jgi:rhodanese-related sulfurtransferase
MKKLFPIQLDELNPIRVLLILSFFAVIIIIGFLTMRRPLLSFEQDMNQSLTELNQSDAFFYPWQLEDFIKNKNQDIALFDIRDHFLYGQGSIPGSRNITAHDLALKENIEMLENLKKKGVTVVLYGEDQLQANGPWMLFRQVGFDNIKILVGGYKYYSLHKENLAAGKTDSTLLFERPRFDFATIAAQNGGATAAPEATAKKTITVQRKAKTGSAGGGC